MKFVLVWHPHEIKAIEPVTKPFVHPDSVLDLFWHIAQRELLDEREAIAEWMKEAKPGEWTRIYGSILIAVGDVKEGTK